MSGRRVILAVRPGGCASRVALIGEDLAILGRSATTPEAGDLMGLIDRTIHEAHHGGHSLGGLAFALPAARQWGDIAAEAGRRHGVPSAAERTARSALEGERIRGIAGRACSAILLDTDALRLALQIDGRPYDGAYGEAGDVAHLGLDRTGRCQCRCGRTGCLAALVEAGEDAPDPPRPRSETPPPSRRLGWLAVAGIALTNVLNPDVMILDGAATEDPAGFDWFAATVRDGCLGPTRVGLRDIVRAHPDSALVGAAARFAALHG